MNMPGAPLSKNDRLLLAVVCIGMFMGMLDVSIVNIAIPTVCEQWQITTATAMWIIFAYMLAYGSLLPTFGKVGERVGFRRLYTIGFLTFAIGSFFSGISIGIDTLVLARFIQGAGAAMMGALSLACVTRYLPKETVGRSMGLVATSAATGAAVGPVLGGLITQYINFHWIFLINVPIGILGAYLSAKVIPCDLHGTGHKFDRLGSIFIFFTLFGLIYGLNLGQEKGWTSPDIIISLIASVVFLFLFLWNERRVPDPLLPIKLIKKPEVLRPMVATMMVMGAFNGAFVLLPYYLEGVIGLLAGAAGAVLLASSVTMLFAGLFSGHLSDRHSPRKLYLIFNAIAIAAFALMALFSVDTGMALILIALVLMGLGIAASFPPNNKQVLLRFPRELAGEGSGTVMALRVVGQTVGTAVMVTVFQSFFYPGHESKADLASGFSTAVIVALVMLIISLVLVYLTSDPPLQEKAEAVVVV